MKLLENHFEVSLLAGGLTLLWLLYRTYLLVSFRQTYKFPNLVPGGLPLFGNMFQIPKDTAERRLYLEKLAKKYGEMYCIESL